MYILKRDKLYFVGFDMGKGTKKLSENKEDAYCFKNIEDCIVIREELNKYDSNEPFELMES